MHGLPGNAGQRHLTGEMEYYDVAAFCHDRIRNQFRVIRRQRSARRVISIRAIESTKIVLGKPQTAWGCPAATRVLGNAMIDSIRAWISGSWPDHRKETGRRQEALQLALTALLIEAANSDDRFDETERGVISRLLESRFNLSRSDADELLAAGETAASESAELFHFTRTINERLSFEERVELIEMLWEVAYADGVLDEYEDSLLRRVGGLIYVPDRERGEARQRVLRRLGLDQAT
jgi:uncharacterized tellurite resistance protein B-like protein